VLKIAVAKCAEQYPKLIISGTYSPPYAKLLDLNDDEIERRIREVGADILLVAMGCPKQEKWIYKNCRKTGVPVSIGIGASLDFIAGKFSRAPVWMRVCGLEWVFRLMQEPRRLFSRYLFDLVFFVARLRKERRILKGGASIASEKAAVVTIESGIENAVRFAWSGRIDAAAVANGTALAPAPERSRPNMLLDCSNVTFIDSTGLGLFIKCFRRCKELGGTFVVFKPSDAVEKMLSLMQLDRLIPMARGDDEARAFFKTTAPATTEFTQFDAATKTVCVPLSGDITAATVKTCERFLVSAWSSAIQARQLDLDLSGVSFIDSSGLGLLVKAVKIVKQREGATLHIGNPSPNVRNVINLANLGTLLGVLPQP
jgi:N-acetylglucosaminyldiphosphoundecaprenol N-acetyl-beta-D-mannosaminyltransferase